MPSARSPRCRAPTAPPRSSPSTRTVATAAFAPAKVNLFLHVGASDAGAALRLLREALNLQIEDDRLEAIAAGLGADGAACLWGRPVIAEGRGERLAPAPGLPIVDAVLVNPGVPVSTAEVYRAF